METSVAQITAPFKWSLTVEIHNYQQQTLIHYVVSSAINIESLASTSTKNYLVCYITLILFERIETPIV